MKGLESYATEFLDALAAIDAGKVLVAVEREEHTIAFVYACRESPLADILTAMIRRAEADYTEMGDRTPNPYDLLDIIAQAAKHTAENHTAYETGVFCRDIIAIMKSDGKVKRTPTRYDALDLIGQAVERATAPDEPQDAHSLNLLCREIVAILKG